MFYLNPAKENLLDKVARIRKWGVNFLKTSSN
jgi:hypothetical protein